MNNPLPAILKVLLGLLVVAVLVVSAFGLGMSVGTRHPLVVGSVPARPAGLPLPSPALSAFTGSTPEAGVASPTPASKSTELLDTALLNEVWVLLQKQYYGDLPQGKEITYDALRGIVGNLGDPHTAFLDPKDAAIMNSDIEGRFEGIGARVDTAPGGGVLITYLFPGQPAELAGIQVGDVITAVDGQDVTRLTLTDAIVRIRGPKDTAVVLTVQRGNQVPLDITVTRARIEIPVVTTKTIAASGGGGNLAYVSLAEFSSIATEKLSDALTQTLAGQPSGLILDLRGNPGGLLDAAVRIGSFFVPQGNILLERQKDGTQRAYPREGRYLLGSVPLVVLIDQGSASASEIVAGAIQDAGTGVLIGERSYGKGSVQLPNNLSDGSQLRVTIAHWFTPKDRAIDKVGLAPDYVVPVTQADVDARRDPQLDAAVKYLSGDRSGLQTPTPGVTRSPARPLGTGTATPVPTPARTTP